VAYFIAESKSGSNLLSKAALSDLMDLHLTISSAESTEGDELSDLCVESGYSLALQCFMSNILQAWSYDAATLAAETDASVLTTLGAAFAPDELASLLGNEQYSDSPADTAVESARAVKVTYFLKSDLVIVNNRYETVKNDAWELKFLDIVQSYRSEHFKLYAFATRSFSDEFGDAIGGDVILINIAYYVMIIYLSINLGKYPCRPVCPNPGSRVLLAFASVVAILLSMGSAFGLCAGMGFMWTPVHSVLPFVILGLGVDDSFVITSAFDATDRSRPIVDRMRLALAHAATSITVTSLTDFTAFAISTSSALPALSSFCVYAAVTILFLFILQITFFTAALCLDEERQRSRHLDCFPCCSDSCVACCVATPCCSPLPEEELGGDQDEGGKRALAMHEQGSISKFLEFTFCPIILSKPGKAAVIAAFAALLAVCCAWGIPNLAVEDNLRAFVPDGSYLLDTFDADDKYFSGEGVTLYIVTPSSVDYFAAQGELTALKDDAEALSPKYTVSPAGEPSSWSSWYDSYAAYCAANSVTDYTTNEESFYVNLHAFLQSPWGGYFNSSIVFDGPRKVQARPPTTHPCRHGGEN